MPNRKRKHRKKQRQRQRRNRQPTPSPEPPVLQVASGSESTPMPPPLPPHRSNPSTPMPPPLPPHRLNASTNEDMYTYVMSQIMSVEPARLQSIMDMARLVGSKRPVEDKKTKLSVVTRKAGEPPMIPRAWMAKPDKLRFDGNTVPGGAELAQHEVNVKLRQFIMKQIHSDPAKRAKYDSIMRLIRPSWMPKYKMADIISNPKDLVIWLQVEGRPLQFHDNSTLRAISQFGTSVIVYREFPEEVQAAVLDNRREKYWKVRSLLSEKEFLRQCNTNSLWSSMRAFYEFDLGTYNHAELKVGSMGFVQPELFIDKPVELCTMDEWNGFYGMIKAVPEYFSGSCSADIKIIPGRLFRVELVRAPSTMDVHGTRFACQKYYFPHVSVWLNTFPSVLICTMLEYMDVGDVIVYVNRQQMQNVYFELG